MKIALVGTVASAILGFRRDFILELVSRNFTVYAFATDYNPELRGKVLELGAIPVDYKMNRSGLNPVNDVLSLFELRSLFKEIKPHIVFSFFSKPVIFATLAAKFAGVNRIIGMLEGLGYVFTDQPNGLSLKLLLLRRVQVLLYRLAIPLLDRVIFLNKDDPFDLIKRNSIKSRHIDILGGIGLRLEDYLFSIPPIVPVRFIFVGRLLAEKGIYDFIEAARIVKRRCSSAEFVVLGSVDSANPGSIPQKTLDDLVSERLIVYPGQVSNVVEWLSGSSVFVLPSYYREGFPRSTQEAMAVGRPIITTDVPGCRETVMDGVNGYLVPKWSPEKLAEKMFVFVKEPNLIAVMGLQSRQVAEKEFDSKLVNSRLFDIVVGNDD